MWVLLLVVKVAYCSVRRPALLVAFACLGAGRRLFVSFVYECTRVGWLVVPRAARCLSVSARGGCLWATGWGGGVLGALWARGGCSLIFGECVAVCMAVEDFVAIGCIVGVGCVSFGGARG